MKQQQDKAGAPPAWFSALRKILDIRRDTDKSGTVKSILDGIEFTGATTWSLIFAVFIASIGLNTNSTAVIIGAMLISPLMGPIMGAGLALGLGDLDIFRRSVRNLIIMTATALVASTLYFLLSPLKDAQSELLNRTYPTIYDVLIAAFGGSIGIIASSRKNKFSNAIPGVAIATALMPPLCTAGYAIANGNVAFFLGALYLYALNSFFIGISTFVFVKYLGLHPAQKLQSPKFSRARAYTILFSVLFVLPSIYMAYNVIQQSSLKQKVEKFVEKSFRFDKSKVINANLQTENGKPTLEVSLVGEPLPRETVEQVTQMLPLYGLAEVKLRVIQNASGGNVSGGAATAQNIAAKDEQIALLERQLREVTQNDLKMTRIAKELTVLFPELSSISYGDLLMQDLTALSAEKNYSIFLAWKAGTPAATRKKLQVYLKLRLNTENLSFVEDKR